MKPVEPINSKHGGQLTSAADQPEPDPRVQIREGEADAGRGAVR